MKQKAQLFAAAFSLVFAAGCGSYEPVYFASEVKPPASVTGAQKPASYLPKADENRIQILVYSQYICSMRITVICNTAKFIIH